MELKVKSLLLAGALVCSLGFMSSCSSSSDSVPNYGGEDANKSGVVPKGDPNNMKFATFSGVVKSNGTPLPGVTVISGTQKTKSDLNGFYKFDQVNITDKDRVIVTFEKAGYMDVTRSIPKANGSRLDVEMVAAQYDAVIDATSPQTIYVGSGSDQVTVELPDEYAISGGGSYSGSTVNVTAVYLDPDNENFASQMPGDLSAIDKLNPEEQLQLISYGMVAVDLRGDGNVKLELASGKTATLKFPIPDNLKENAPLEIPLWYFDEAEGLWVKEGKATLQNNAYYEGTVSHFSWHNLDSPELKATINVTVLDKNDKPLPFVPVDIDGQRLFYTDKNGKMTCDVPSEVELTIKIPSQGYGNYANGDPTKEKKVTVTLGGSQTQLVTFKFDDVALPRISGTVTNIGGGSNICSVYIRYNGYIETSPTLSDINGAFQIFAPDPTTLTTTNATIIAIFGNGEYIQKDIILDGTDQTVELTANNNSSSSVTGTLIVSNDDGLYQVFTLPAGPLDGYWPAEIDESGLSVSGDDVPGGGDIDWNKVKEINQFSMSIPNYNPSQSTYNNASFHFMREGGPHLFLDVDNATATVTKNGDIYTLKMTNAVSTRYEDQMLPDLSGTINVTVELNAKEKK